MAYCDVSLSFLLIRLTFWLSSGSGSSSSRSNTNERWEKRGRDTQPRQLASTQSCRVWRSCSEPMRHPAREKMRWSVYHTCTCCADWFPLIYQIISFSLCAGNFQVIGNLSQVLDRQKEKLEKMRTFTHWRLKHAEAKEEVSWQKVKDFFSVLLYLFGCDDNLFHINSTLIVSVFYLVWVLLATN